MMSFFLLTLGFSCSSFSNALRWWIKLSIWDFLLFRERPVLLWTSLWALLLWHPMDFEWLCLHDHLSWGIFFLISFLISSLTHWFFSSMLFSLHVVGFFSLSFLWLCSSFMPLWSEKVLEIISILLNLLRLALCPKMWSILENVPCALKKNVYSVVLDVMSSKCPLSLTFLVFPLGSLMPYGFSVRRICPLMWVGC